MSKLNDFFSYIEEIMNEQGEWGDIEAINVFPDDHILELRFNGGWYTILAKNGKSKEGNP